MSCPVSSKIGMKAGTAQGRFWDRHSSTCAHGVRLLTRLRERGAALRRLSAAVAGAESGAALHLQRLCDLLRAKLAVSFACVDVFGSQRPCSCTLAASGCAESHLPLGMPRLHTPADAAELRVLLPPLGPGAGHTSYSHLSASTLLGATTLSAHSAAANAPSCGCGNRSNPTSPGGGLPTSNSAGGAATSGMFLGRRAGGATAQMCSSPSMGMAEAAPGTATAAAGGAVVSGGLARSVAEAAADADVGEGGEASGLTSGDGMDTWGGVEGLGFLHGSPYTAGGGTCSSLALGGRSRAQPELQSTLDALLVLLHPVFVSAFGYGGAAAAAAAGTSAPAPAGTLGALAAGGGDPAASSRQRLAAYLATARVVG
eukprot:XP_001701083.1 predicted protein [Chlamydomonas reinhardtii]